MCTDSGPADHSRPPSHLAPDHRGLGRPESGQTDARMTDPAFAVELLPVDSVSLTILVDNAVDGLMADQAPARRPRMPPPFRLPARTIEGGSTFAALKAEHGFSCLVTVRKDGRERQILFDTGVSPNGMVDNMGVLDVDPTEIEVIVCSHGHFDHTTGLDGLARALGPTNLPVVIHPEFWNRRRFFVPGKDPWELPTTSRHGLEDAGFDIIEERQPSFLFDGSVLITGEVDRTTDYEPGLPPQQVWRDGGWQPDPLVLDDQALVLDVRDKGLVVLTGCGHAGIINITRYAKRLTGADKVHAVIGGFHLGGPMFEPIIPQVCTDLAGFAPQVILPAHCTGWRAQHALSVAFPGAYIPNTVGTTLEL
jgi:7,8-dihydropterin-6-yl-methyl-4-(beta-D-ribofuranosyl)aminobenzene 5'-phosphate synthase